MQTFVNLLCKTKSQITKRYKGDLILQINKKNQSKLQAKKNDYFYFIEDVDYPFHRGKL